MEQKQAAVTNDTARSVSVAREPSPQQSVFHDTPFYFLQRLHGHIGNRAAGRWLQTKLRVGAINDSYEQEADRVADLVMRMPQTRAPEFAGLGTGQVLQRCSCGGTCSSCTALENERPIPVQRLAIASMPPSWIQREATESCSVKEEATSPEEAKEDAEADQPQPGEDPEEEEKQEGKEQQTQVQPKRHAAPAVSPDDIEERLNASRGQGEPLAPETRQIMEDRFGYDFSRVRIHNAAYAHRLNQDLNALAFTTGTDIYFAPSQFQPGTPVGQHLLAHELTHVVQQAGGSGGIVREKAAPGMISRSGKPEDKHDRLLGYYRTLEISGEYVHFRIERILRNADDQLVTEAAIPGADRFGHELNKIGVADLYKSNPAKTVTGVKGYQPVEKPRDIVAMDNPDAVGTKPGVKSLPKISGKRDDPVRPWTGDFPQKIEIGEIKPLSRAKVAAGLFQLDQYTQGYKAFVERIHKISSSTRASIDVERLHLTIPAFLNFDNWATQHSKPESQTTISTRRLWVADIGNGLYVYFDIDHGLIGPPTKWEKEVAEMRKIRADLGDGKHPRTDKMDPLVSGRFLPGGPRLAPPRSTSLPSPRLIQRSTKDRPDKYWAERGRLWEEKRSRWGKAFRAELKTSYRAYRQKLQIEKRLGRTSRSAPAAEKSEVREYKQLMFWSGLPGRFLGKIRFLMGTAWDKVMAIFERMKERMHDLRKKIFGTSEEATFAYGWRKTLIKILVKAAKVAVIKFITESFNFFVQCFESAIDKVWEKFQGELQERFAEELCKARKFFEESKERLEKDWGVSFEKLQELFKIIQDAKHWVDIATGLIQLIRLGVQVISCLTPPALGCLWGLVAQIGIGTALDLVIGTQWFNDNILSPTIGDLVRTYATPYYQKLINRALGDDLKEYHCHIADEKPSSSGFGAVTFNDGLREGSPELLQHRDNWEANNRDAMTKDLQAIFQKGKGRKVSPEELQQLAEEIKKANKPPEEIKKLLEASRDPLTGRLKIEVAQENVKRGELPKGAEGEGKERKIDYPKATRRNKELQRTLHWDPMTFYKKPGVAVDSEEFADAVYDMQEALRIDKDGILGEQTLLAFYDRNKLKPDAAYEAATKLKEEKQAAREKAAKEKEEKAAKEKKEKEEKAKGKEKKEAGGDLVAISVPKPPTGTEIREAKYPYDSFPLGTSDPDIKQGETHAVGEPLTINVRYWLENKYVWFKSIPVTFKSFDTFTLPPAGLPRRFIVVNVAEDFYFKLTQDATITYIFSKADRAIFLDPGYSTILTASPQPVQKLQRKLRVGASDDPYEQEADRVADRVMRMPQPGALNAEQSQLPEPVVQRECAACGEEEELQRKCALCEGEEEKLQRKCAECEEEEKKTGPQRKETGAGPQFAPPAVHAVLNSPGRPLDPAARAFMEPRFGQDFSGVRIHTDTNAAESATAVNALAYASGQHVVFGSNQYSPGTPEGQRLLAHELAHVVQSKPHLARQPANPQPNPTPNPPTNPPAANPPSTCTVPPDAAKQIADQGIPAKVITSMRYGIGMGIIRAGQAKPVTDALINQADAAIRNQFGSLLPSRSFSKGGSITKQTPDQIANARIPDLAAARRRIRQVALRTSDDALSALCITSEDAPVLESAVAVPVLASLGIDGVRNYEKAEIGGVTSFPTQPKALPQVTLPTESTNPGHIVVHEAMHFYVHDTYRRTAEASPFRRELMEGGAEFMARLVIQNQLPNDPNFQINYGTYAGEFSFINKNYTIGGSFPLAYLKGRVDVIGITPVQPKMEINQSGAPLEQEADRMADQVMRTPQPGAVKAEQLPEPIVQRECAACGEEEELQRKCAQCEGEEEELQRKCAECEEEDKKIGPQRKETGAGPQFAPPAVHAVLNSPGRPLDPAARAFMEPRFGQDFGGVRIHTDDAAARSAQAVKALAYTVGSSVVFAAHRYTPETTEGRHLLAHELTHVVQQNASSRLPARAAQPPLLEATGMIQRQADVSALPPALPCVTILSPGHPAGTDLMFGFVDTSLNAAHVTAVTSFFTSWAAAGSSNDIAVDGFASTGGLQQDNWKRSCDRAENVKTKLVALGAPAAKITTFAHGESTEYGPAMPPNDRAVIHTSAGLLASDLRIDSARRGGDTDSIFFDRGGSTVTEPSQLSKIAPLATANSGNDLTLFGFVSEDENVPAASGTALATARTTEVSSKLGTAGHGKPRTPNVSQTGSGAGQIGYRDMRKVVVKVAGGGSGVSNCGAGSLIACSPTATFTDAQKRAAGAASMLEKAIGFLTPPISAANKAFLHDRFGTTPANEASIADIVKTNLTNLKPHIATQMTPVSTLGPPPSLTPSPGHRCANSCDGLCGNGASAYNNEVDAAATMTLCDTPTGFMKEADLDKRAGILIHEGLHGITLKVGPIAPAAGPAVSEPGATDFAYHEQRLIKFLDPLTALKNNDSYVVLIFQMLGLPITIGRPTTAPGPDVVTAGAIPAGQRLEVDRALAWLEGWLVPTSLEVSSLYDTIKESIPPPHTWKSTYYMNTMKLLAPRFSLTMPPSLPTLAEQFQVAAIQERLERMSNVLYNVTGLSIARVTPGPTSWAAGPAATVNIGDDFFALPAAGKPRAQLELLLREIIKATTGVSAEAVPRYADLVNQIRIHLGIGGP